MAAARYWRLVGLEAHAGGDLELSELHLYDGAGRADVPGMLSASAAPIAGAVSDLSDGNSATLCRFAVGDVAAGGFKLEWDLGAGNEKDCTGVRIGASTDPNLFLARCFLQSSTDGYAWNTTASWDRFAWPGAGTMTVAPQVGDSSYNNNVTLLMHCDSATDSSATPKTITAHGGAAFTGTGLFGAGLRIAGAGVVLVDHHADLSLGSSDFTVEIAYYPTSVSAVAILLNKANGTTTPYPLQLYHTAGGGLIARSYGALESLAWQISAGTVVANQWNYIAVERSGSTIRLYLGGSVVGTTTFSGTAADNSDAVSIGAYSTAAYPINGVLDEIRVTKGVARYKGAYSPQASPFPNTTGGGVVLVAPPVRTPVRVSTTGASAPVPSPDMRTFGPLVGRDVEFGGRASITGTVGIKGTGGAPDTMTKSRVRLLRQRDGLLAREVWSDPVTGAFAFDGLDESQQFIALAEDNAGVFAPVAADRRTPEVPT